MHVHLVALAAGHFLTGIGLSDLLGLLLLKLLHLLLEIISLAGHLLKPRLKIPIRSNHLKMVLLLAPQARIEFVIVLATHMLTLIQCGKLLLQVFNLLLCLKHLLLLRRSSWRHRYRRRLRTGLPWCSRFRHCKL